MDRAVNQNDEEYRLLGLALIAVQRVEFSLYRIASHASHLPAAQSEKRFRDLTPEKFLRGDESELKATFGQLVHTFGDAFLISTPDLVAFYEDRNLLAHNYWRTFHSKFGKATDRRREGIDFLYGFLERAQYWERVLRGLLAEMKRTAAEKFGRTAELQITEDELECTKVFLEHVTKHRAAKNGQNQ